MMKPEFELALNESAHNSLGIYPASVVKDGIVEKRTEYSNGWNDCQMEFYKKMVVYENWFLSLTNIQQEIVGELLTKEILWLHSDLKPGYPHPVMMVINCNDLFLWGCADSEEIMPDELETVWELYQKNKDHGTSKWCCLKRRWAPQKPIIKMWKECGFWDAELEALPHETRTI